MALSAHFVGRLSIGPNVIYICGIGTAVPANRYTKAQCLEAFEHSDWFHRLSARSRFIAQSVLNRDNGIETRWLAVDSLHEAFAIDPDTLARRFLMNAPGLGAAAATRAMKNSGISSQEIDAVVVSTCTGYLCPGLSGYIIEQLHLPRETQAFDLVGQGCAAALPNLALGSALLASQTCQRVLSICVEVSSAAMYLDDDPGVLISACLFGDGAGAAVLSSKPSSNRSIHWKQYASIVEPSQRDALKFELRGGLLRNILTRGVPALAAKYGLQLLETVLKASNMAASELTTWIMHAGGRDVLQAIEKQFDLDSHDLRYSSAMLREYGNLSSAFVYFVLEAAIADKAPEGHWWLSSFGAGFSCHGALLEVL